MELGIGVTGTLTVDEGSAIAIQVHGELVRHVPSLGKITTRVEPHTKSGHDAHTH